MIFHPWWWVGHKKKIAVRIWVKNIILPISAFYVLFWGQQKGKTRTLRQKQSELVVSRFSFFEKKKHQLFLSPVSVGLGLGVGEISVHTAEQELLLIIILFSRCSIFKISGRTGLLCLHNIHLHFAFLFTSTDDKMWDTSGSWQQSKFKGSYNKSVSLAGGNPSCLVAPLSTSVS